MNSALQRARATPARSVCRELHRAPRSTGPRTESPSRLGQPAYACYLRDGHAPIFHAHGLIMLILAAISAAIAAIHDQAPQAADTDLPQILALYGLLDQMTGDPVVGLNRAVPDCVPHSRLVMLASCMTYTWRGHYPASSSRRACSSET